MEAKQLYFYILTISLFIFGPDCITSVRPVGVINAILTPWHHQTFHIAY